MRLMSRDVSFHIWWFPNMVIPPNHPCYFRMSHCKQYRPSIFWYPHGNPHIKTPRENRVGFPWEFYFFGGPFWLLPIPRLPLAIKRRKLGDPL